MIEQLPTVTSWGQAVLLLMGAGIGIKWITPLVIRLVRKNGNSVGNSAEKRTYEAVGRIMARIEESEKVVRKEIADTRHDVRNAVAGSMGSLEEGMRTGFKDLSQVMQRIEVLLSRGQP